MEDTSFTLDIEIGGQQRSFPARLAVTGYAYRFILQAGDAELIFEPDEERQIRAILPPEAADRNISPALVQAIAQELQRIISS